LRDFFRGRLASAVRLSQARLPSNKAPKKRNEVIIDLITAFYDHRFVSVEGLRKNSTHF